MEGTGYLLEYRPGDWSGWRILGRNERKYQPKRETVSDDREEGLVQTTRGREVNWRRELEGGGDGDGGLGIVGFSVFRFGPASRWYVVQKVTTATKFEGHPTTDPKGYSIRVRKFPRLHKT
jgi:hypothetical protein